MYLSVIVPVFNESESVPRLLAQIAEPLSRLSSLTK